MASSICRVGGGRIIAQLVVSTPRIPPRINSHMTAGAALTRSYSSDHAAGPVVDPVKGKVVSDKAQMPDGLGHAVGPERWELLTRLAGNEDPFEMNVKKRAKGTRDEPTLIPSMYEKRLVGCICEEDAISIKWMFLCKGEQKRCHCGYWYKLVEVDPSKYGPHASVPASHGAHH